MSVKSKFSECPDFSCSRSDGTLEPVTSSFPAESESLRANSQSSAVVQPVRPLSRSFSPVRVQSGKKPVSQEKPVVTVVTVEKNPLSQEKPVVTSEICNRERQRGRVVRAPDLNSGGRGFKSRSDH